MKIKDAKKESIYYSTNSGIDLDYHRSMNAAIRSSKKMDHKKVIVLPKMDHKHNYQESDD
jgi:hypothetical protein